ncbi:hypothetical protein [Undibacterium luofuense]|nr:hypothetical protein [Undibacterium luofuense]
MALQRRFNDSVLKGIPELAEIAAGSETASHRCQHAAILNSGAY